MALVTPVGVQDGTQTSGTANYTLTGTTVTGRRSLADAVTDGDVANSDTLYYVVIDDTTQGASLDWEYGKGTVSSSGAAVSRDTIVSSSNSGAKVSWGAGGTRTFIVVTGDWALVANEGSEYTPATFATNLGLPRLAAANQFTANQLIKKSGTAQLKLESNDATGNPAEVRFDGADDGGGRKPYARVQANIVQSIAGSEVGKILWAVTQLGTLTSRLELRASGDLLKVSTGNTYDAFPSGFVMLAESVPTGWTRGNVTSGRLIKLAESGDTLGAEVGTGNASDPFSGSWVTDNHTLTVSEIPSHTHLVSELIDAVDKNADGVTVGKGDNLNHEGSNDALTSATGGGGSHSHNLTTPNYRVLGRIVKN